MIRAAHLSDVPRIVEMGRRFRVESTYNKHLADNPERMTRLAEQLIGQGGLLIAEQNGDITGMIGFILHDHFISGEKFAGEIFWWQEPEYRGIDGLKLLREAEKVARAAGAKYLQMIAPNDRITKLYKLRGYEFVESTYQLAL